MGLFSFLKKADNGSPPAKALKTDVHSHLIPGIDDGAKDIDESLEIIKGLVDLGYSKVITSPHIISDYYPNNKTTIYNGLNKLKEAVAQAGLHIEIEVAAEYYIDDYFENLIANQPDEILTFNQNLVLVETGFLNKPANLFDVLFQMVAKGFVPVLVHPERYLYIMDDFSIAKELHNRNITLCCNVMSFSGYYGPQVKKTVFKLADENLISLVGSDIHKPRHLPSLAKSLKTKKFKNLLEKGVFNPNL